MKRLIPFIAAAMVLTGCSSQPDYAGRKMKPASAALELKGTPKNIVEKEYLSLDDFNNNRPSTTQKVDFDREGYIVCIDFTNEAQHSVTNYKFRGDCPGKYESVESVKEYVSSPASTRTISTYYYDSNDNVSKIMQMSDGVPTVESYYNYNDKGYPVEFLLYKAGNSGDNFERKEVYAYENGLLTKLTDFYQGSKVPYSEADMIDNGEYDNYKPQKVVYYDSNGNVKNIYRYTYDDAMHVVLEQTSDDGTNWITTADRVYDHDGNPLVEKRYHKDHNTEYRWNYTFDEKGNWIKKTDGDAVYTREISYY